MTNNTLLIRNFSYLSALQIFNTLIPIMSYPYLIRVLGDENYGLTVFAQAVVSYLLVIVSFGFNFSATKEISLHRDNREKLSEIVSSVLLIKGILFLLCMVILSLFLVYLPSAKGYEALFLLTMWICLYDVMLPIWYFQGIEKMKYVVYFNVFSKSLFLLLIFVFIQSQDDYLLLPLLNGICAFLAGVGSLYIVFHKHKISLEMQKLENLKKYFVDSIAIFTSNFSIKLYASTNKVLVGSLFGMEQVSYYDLAEKLSVLLKTPIQIVGQTLFPRVSKEKNKTFLQKCFYLVMSISLMLLIISILMSKSIIFIIGGQQMQPAISLFNILIISIIPVTFSLFFANLSLIPFGFNNDFLKARLFSMCFYLATIFLLFYFELIIPLNLAIVVVGVEIVVAIISIYYCDHREINFLRSKPGS